MKHHHLTAGMTSNATISICYVAAKPARLAKSGVYFQTPSPAQGTVELIGGDYGNK